MTPLPAIIALSALDDHFARQWQQLMKTPLQRQARRKRGLGKGRHRRGGHQCLRRLLGPGPSVLGNTRGAAGNRRHPRKFGAESVLIPGGHAARWPAETAL
jgi:hypothetical protein